MPAPLSIVQSDPLPQGGLSVVSSEPLALVAPRGTIGPKPQPKTWGGQLADWASSAANDVRYGGDQTFVGRTLHALGATPTSHGVSPQTDDLMTSPYLGPLQTMQGAGELVEPGRRRQGVSNVIEGLGKTSAPLVALTPEAQLPKLVLGAAGGYFGAKGGGSAARALDAEPETERMVTDLGGLAGGLAGAGANSPRVGAAAKGAVRGAVKESMAPVSVPMIGDVPAIVSGAGAGFGVGETIPGLRSHPLLASAVGAAVPPIRGALRGGTAAWKNFGKAPEVPPRPYVAPPPLRGHSLPPAGEEIPQPTVLGPTGQPVSSTGIVPVTGPAGSGPVLGPGGVPKGMTAFSAEHPAAPRVAASTDAKNLVLTDYARSKGMTPADLWKRFGSGNVKDWHDFQEEALAYGRANGYTVPKRNYGVYKDINDPSIVSHIREMSRLLVPGTQSVPPIK